MSSIRQEATRGVKWTMIRKLTLDPLQFVFGMILARLVSPEEMGILGLTGLFFALANSLKEAGLGSALIRKQNRTEEDTCTVFWFNMAANLVVSTLFWLAAPWFAAFFDQPALLWLTRVSAVMMFLNASASVHWTLYSARRDFKTPAIISIISTVVAIPVTLYTAYIGWSYWAVMLQGVVSGLLSLIMVWIVSPWRPKLLFSARSFHELFGFGFRLALTGCMWQTYDHIVNFVIGKFYNPSQLALYSRANSLGNLPTSFIFTPVSGIMYPILATIQEDKERLDVAYRKFMRLTMMPMLWVMVTLAVNAYPLIRLFYGETWLDCVIFLQVLCMGQAISPLILVNHSYLMVKGRSDLLLNREVAVRISGLILMLGGAWHSVLGVCWGFTLSNLINLIITIRMSVKVSGISIRQQMMDFVPYLLLCLMSNIPAWLLTMTSLSPVVSAFVGPLMALSIYVTILCIKKDEALMILKETYLAKLFPSK